MHNRVAFLRVKRVLSKKIALSKVIAMDTCLYLGYAPPCDPGTALTRRFARADNLLRLRIVYNFFFLRLVGRCNTRS